MKQAAQILCGEHDFAAFRAAGAKEGDSVRRIDRIEIVEQDWLLQIRMTGNGFLYKMARGLAGTILDAGKGLLTPAQVREILESKDREKAGMTLPPMGLYLEQVIY
jgi:tRNA pseudouridine38-40 synthase